MNARLVDHNDLVRVRQVAEAQTQSSPPVSNALRTELTIEMRGDILGAHAVVVLKESGCLEIMRHPLTEEEFTRSNDVQESAKRPARLVLHANGTEGVGLPSFFDPARLLNP